jgi:hypothetical protein
MEQFLKTARLFPFPSQYKHQLNNSINPLVARGFIDFYKKLPKDIDENNLPIDFWMDVYEVTSATRYPEEEC